ncbi:antibiotic biosynthesis monooxygenase [Neobacillus drentensis]|uniref:antibiotic biosynthesis monooxygenase family protein n=1 Tax=Neobacillus drentensis TaxID=220684 RepID=UPI001F30AD5A|nr:antibiotic biosynthesis monooxygenase [Neobacillus drentensis]ULT59245.1 antibiotic biosynthesis monooxygenase [Neobacillus drentensis]
MNKAPQPPYYAVIFTSGRTDGDKGYGKMSKTMEELALIQPGFIGMESARDSQLGITVSYWESVEAIEAWKNHAVHRLAQQKGKEEWYQNYTVRISKVERAYSFEK